MARRHLSLVITASNGTLPDAIQNFTLTVQATPPVLQAPAITSATARATFTVGAPGDFAITTAGTPTSQVSLIGTAPELGSPTSITGRYRQLKRHAGFRKR